MKISDLKITDSHAILTQEQFDKILTTQKTPSPQVGVIWKRLICLSPEKWSLFWFSEQDGKIVGNHRYIKLKSKNTNCLEGMRCPECQQEDVFHIEAKVLVEVRDNGTEDLQTNYEWEDEAFCKCPVCEFDATLKEFTIDHQEKLLLSSKNICIDCSRDYTADPLEDDEVCICRTEGGDI